MTIDRPHDGCVPALKQLWQQAFGDPEAFTDGFFRTGFSPERCRCVFLDGTVAAALYWFDGQWREKRIAYLYAIATDRQFRNRGLCQALMEDTHTHLKKLGYAGAALVPADRALFSFYEKASYRPFCPMQKLQITAGAPVCIRPINPAEYAKLRRAYLPENGIVQEGQTLSFLESYTRFYAGEGFICCCAREEDTVHFQEYLGDPAQLPGTVGALGRKQGTVRLRGGSEPFAMYRSLTEDTASPAYLGIALD